MEDTKLISGMQEFNVKVDAVRTAYNEYMKDQNKEKYFAVGDAIENLTGILVTDLSGPRALMKKEYNEARDKFLEECAMNSRRFQLALKRVDDLNVERWGWYEGSRDSVFDLLKGYGPMEELKTDKKKLGQVADGIDDICHDVCIRIEKEGW